MSGQRAARGFLAFLLLLLSSAASAQSPAVVPDLTQRAAELFNKGSRAEALATARRALALSEVQHGADSTQAARAMEMIADIQLSQGHLSEAKLLHGRSRTIYEKHWGPESEKWSWLLQKRAGHYRQGRHFEESEGYLLDVIRILTVAHGPKAVTLAQPRNDLAGLYRDRGRYADAAAQYVELVSLFEGAAESNAQPLRTMLNNLGNLYREMGRYDEAWGLLKRSLAMREAALGPDHADVAVACGNLAELLKEMGRLSEAEPLYERALRIFRAQPGGRHRHVDGTLRMLAGLYSEQGRFADAEQLFTARLREEEEVGSEMVAVAAVHESLAGLYERQGQFGRSEQHYRKALAIREPAQGPQHLDVALTRHNLADLCESMGRYEEAERLYREALAVREAALGPGHTAVARSLNGLAVVYRVQRRDEEAVALYRRVLSIDEAVLGPEHPTVATGLNNLAVVYEYQGKLDEAESLHRRALAIIEKAHGPDSSQTAGSLNNLAEVLKRQGRTAEAEPLLKRSFAIMERRLGDRHATLAKSAINLGGLLRAQGKDGEAEALYRRALAIRERSLGPDHPDVASSLYDIALFEAARQNWREVLTLTRRANAIRRAAVMDREVNAEAAGGRHFGFRGYSLMVRAAHMLAGRHPEELDVLRSEAFAAAQNAERSQADAALAQMSARFAAGSGPMAALARQRQDLTRQWGATDRQLAALLAKPDVERGGADERLRAELASIRSRLNSLDEGLSAQSEQYASLINPNALSIPDVKKLLGENEALVLYHFGEATGGLQSEVHAFALTRSQVEWARLPISGEKLVRGIWGLRCGTDAALWRVGSGVDCSELAGGSGQIQAAAEQGLPPFDVSLAHDLYRALLAPFETLIAGKSLIVVPGNPLMQLPLASLVTRKPADGRASALGEVSWLGTRQPISTLPSAAALKALRQFARTSRAKRPFLGIANPLLEGAAQEAGLAAVAEARQQCAPTERRVQVAQARGRRAQDLSRLYRGSHADVAEVLALSPLPETADEVCEVGLQLGAKAEDVLLGRAATEANLRTLSESGRLGEYRILHFATHGVLAGQIKGPREPGLVLTPGAGRSETDLEQDDGYLTASEIATLKLDADWVVLSACNTGGGAELGDEALSGLARAFFYAGARALLVSQWEVQSEAAVALTTRAFAVLQNAPHLGRAEAMRQAMHDLVARGGVDAHPAVWAPFVMVGEGAAVR